MRDELGAIHWKLAKEDLDLIIGFSDLENTIAIPTMEIRNEMECFSDALGKKMTELVSG